MPCLSAKRPDRGPVGLPPELKKLYINYQSAHPTDLVQSGAAFVRLARLARTDTPPQPRRSYSVVSSREDIASPIDQTNASRVCAPSIHLAMASSLRDSFNSLSWSRREEAPINTSQQSGLMSSIRSLNPFNDRGYVQLPTTESSGAPLPAPNRREEEEGWFARESP